MAKAREVRITLRVTQTLRDDFAAVAKLKGMPSSVLLHAYMTQKVHETKKDFPEEFKIALKEATESARSRSEEKKKASQKIKIQNLHPNMVTIDVIESAPDELGHDHEKQTG